MYANRFWNTSERRLLAAVRTGSEANSKFAKSANLPGKEEKVFKVVKAEYETGCYRLFSSVTNNLYDIICYDGIFNRLDETTVASPVSFTVRGCVNKDAAIQKIKRYLKNYEKSIITIKK